MIQSQIDCLVEERRRVVAEARSAGDSWRAIAERIGVTLQAAQKRYGSRPKTIEDAPLSDPLFDPLFPPPKD